MFFSCQSVLKPFWNALWTSHAHLGDAVGGELPVTCITVTDRVVLLELFWKFRFSLGL